MITWPALIPSRSKVSLTSNSFNSSSFNGCWGSSPKGTFTTSALPIRQGFLLFEFWGCQLVFLGCLGGGPMYKYWNGWDILETFDSCCSWERFFGNFPKISEISYVWLHFSRARVDLLQYKFNWQIIQNLLDFLVHHFVIHDFVDSNKVGKESGSSISIVSSFHFSLI